MAQRGVEAALKRVQSQVLLDAQHVDDAAVAVPVAVGAVVIGMVP
jgi:hypothetical protein